MESKMNDRLLEAIIYIFGVIILVLLLIDVKCITDTEYIKQNRYDVNQDGKVDWEDIIEVQRVVVGEE